MTDKFEWKAEIKFQGTAEEFHKFREVIEAALETGNISIEIPEWKPRPRHLAGCFPRPIDDILDKVRLEALIKDKARFQFPYIRDIYGGIRTAHLHLGNEVVLLDRAQFKTMVTEVAHELAAKRVEAVEDYVEVMSKVNSLGDDLRPSL